MTIFYKNVAIYPLSPSPFLPGPHICTKKIKSITLFIKNTYLFISL